MSYVLMGHGSLDVQDLLDPDMEIIGIPQGTTLQFYADAGQGLAIGPAEIDTWDQVIPHFSALDSTCVTYNLTLSSAWGQWEASLANDRHLGGHEPPTPPTS
ncbi:hypothetical protein ACWF95_35050 [Streptomyces vinaceus]